MNIQKRGEEEREKERWIGRWRGKGGEERDRIRLN